MDDHQPFIRRTFQLARLGLGSVSPNPMVGAVLVYQGKIIGEGYHQRVGHAHAEVNALQSVRAEDKHLISESTLYVSLEPCCIYGRTPPCTQLIIDHKIPRVVISCLDLTPEVAGRGVQILRDAGVVVVTGVLEEEGQWLARYRNTFATKQRPYIVLKFAQSKDGFMAKHDQQFWITNDLSKRYVHKLRGEMDAILIGSQTARIDDPELTNRLYFGNSPHRIVLNKQADLPTDLKIFQGNTATWWVNEQKEGVLPQSNTHLIKIPFDESLLPNLLQLLYKANKSTLLVEGGAATLQHFIAADLWDEAHILTGDVAIKDGVKVPEIFGRIRENYHLRTDSLSIIQNVHQPILNKK